jgi:serine/threonine-protein kinase 11
LSENGSIDPTKEDVWSLGVTMFESLFGRVPFTGETVYEIAQRSSDCVEFPQTASPEVKHLLERMLCVDPEKRISMAGVAAHPFFRGDQESIGEIAATPPKIKPSNSMVAVSAEVCDDDYVLVPPSTAGSWPGGGGLTIRQFSRFVC